MADPTGEAARAAPVPVDLLRGFVFPNRLRELRRLCGYPKLLRLAAEMPEIPYIRLSKIERGEVVARPEELRRIATALHVAPVELLTDVDAPGFDLALWAEPFRDMRALDLDEERFAVLLGAALRARRAQDSALSIATIDQEYGLPPVNLSRIENAYKIFARWNAATQASLCRIFGVAGEAELRAAIARAYADGALEGFIALVADPVHRLERTRVRIAELKAALEETLAAPAPSEPRRPGIRALLPVQGAPLPGGLIAATPLDERIEAPTGVSAAAFGLKTCRATLGPGLPAQAIVIVDPARYPIAGGIAAVREEAGWRLLAVVSERDGRLMGYSLNPQYEVALDDCDAARVAAVVSAIFP